MADFTERSPLESPKKRPRLDCVEPNDIFPSPIDRETSHLPTSVEINSLNSTGDPHLEGKHLLNFDPESGAGFEHELPSDASNHDSDKVTAHFDNDFLPEQNDSSEHDHCLPSQESSSSPAASDTNASTGPDNSNADSGEGESSSGSGSDEGSVGSLDDGDLDLGLGDCELEQPIGPMGWLQRQTMSGVHPRSILAKLLPTVSAALPEDLDEFEVWSIIADYFQMLREPPRRKKMPDINTFNDALNLLRNSKRIMVLTGAGVSVSCGIPDFRSRDGVYARLAVDFPDLPDPQAIFDIHYFRRNPKPFFKFAKEIYPGEFRPSTCHKFIALLEQHGKLLRNFSQNIDTLEQVAGITRVLQCHGSFATAHCTNCNYQVDAEAIRQDIFNQVVPLCPRCPQDPDVLAVMKPDIVFFGEGLPKDFYHCLEEDKEKADLLIVIGSSLKVQPVATIPNAVPGHIPQILINREPLNHMTFDIELLGDGDVIVNEICRRLGDGWDHICDGEQLVETSDMPDVPDVPDVSDSDSVDKEFETMATPERPEGGFEGADSTSWVCQSEQRSEEASQSPGNDAEDVFQDDRQCNSKVAAEETKNLGNPEEVSLTPKPDPCGLSKATDSSNVGLANEASPEPNMSSPTVVLGDTPAAACVKEEPSQDEGSPTWQKEPVTQLNPTKRMLSAETKSQEHLSGDNKQQESNGAQNGDVSSTVCEDEDKIKDTDSNAVLTGSAVPSEHKISETCEANEAQSQASKGSEEAEFVRNSSQVDGCSSAHGMGVESKGGASSILRTRDETTLEETRPKRKRRNSIALYLQSSSYLFVPPNRYIFHGAEVFPPSRPESPHNGNDEDEDKCHSHPEDHGGMDNKFEAHHAELADQSELPSTSDALIEDLLQEDSVPKLESSVPHSWSDPLHTHEVDPILREDTLDTMENSALHSGWEGTQDHKVDPAINAPLLMPEGSAVHEGTGEDVLPTSEKAESR